MGNIGVWEIALVLLVLLLLFGPKRLPEMGRMMGRGMREFKETLTDHTRELKESVADVPREFQDSLTGAEQEEEPVGEARGDSSKTSV